MRGNAGSRRKIGCMTEPAAAALLAVCVSVICLIPCMQDGLPCGDDISFHMLRVESLLDALTSGQGYPAYIYQTMLEGYGYGVGLFYPDIFLLPAVLFRYMGLAPETAIKFYLFVLMIVTCITSYMAGRGMSGGNPWSGAITMILYTLGHYHIEDMYRRWSLGETIAMAFIPLVFLALYDLTEREHSKKGLLCIAFSCVLLSNTVSFVLCVIAAALWVLLRLKKIKKNPRLLLCLAVEAVCCMLVTCWYWLPVLEQLASDRFYVSAEPAFYTQEDEMTFLGILTGRYSVSFAELAALGLLLLIGVKLRRVSRKGTCFFVACVIALLVETGLFPWELVDKTPLVSIQFPWRLNMFTEFMVACGIGIQTCALVTGGGTPAAGRNRACAIVACVLCIVMGAYNMCIVWRIEVGAYLYYPEGYADEEANTNSIGFWEWLPENGDLSSTVLSDSSHAVLHDEDEITGIYNADGSFEFTADGICGECIIPKYYYKGYAAAYIAPDGGERELAVTKNEDDGLVKIGLSGETGTIRIYYKGTFIQRTAGWISLISVIVFAFARTIMRVHTRKKIPKTA